MAKQIHNLPKFTSCCDKHHHHLLWPLWEDSFFLKPLLKFPVTRIGRPSFSTLWTCQNIPQMPTVSLSIFRNLIFPENFVEINPSLPTRHSPLSMATLGSIVEVLFRFQSRVHVRAHSPVHWRNKQLLYCCLESVPPKNEEAQNTEVGGWKPLERNLPC